MEEILFREAQRFRQKWLWALWAAILVITVGLPAVLLVCVPPQAVPILAWTTAGSTALVLALFWLFWRAELVVEVRRDGAHVRFWPFHRRWRDFPLTEIVRHEAKRYSPIAEYGGWGLRITFGGNVAYNVSGDEGVLLTLRSGKTVMLGSQRARELDAALSAAEK